MIGRASDRHRNRFVDKLWSFLAGCRHFFSGLVTRCPGLVVCSVTLCSVVTVHAAETATMPVGGIPAGKATQGYPMASAFVLRDQYNNTHTYRFPQAKVSLLVLADYAGSKQLEPWIRPVYERYQDTIDIYGVADLAILPGFARGLVRKAFRKQLAYPVMLDWSGDVTKSYNYQSGQANLFVIDRGGQMVLTIIGPVNPSRLQQVFGTIDRLLASQSG